MQVYHTGKLFASIFIATLIAGVLLQRRPDNQPDYSAAQRNTVLVDCDGGQGSGVVIKRGGFVYVWTAFHIISGESSIQAKQFFHFRGHKSGHVSFPATVVWTDSKNDLALLWLDAPADFFTGATFSPRGTQPKVGEPVFHVGNWLGEDFDGSVSVGIVSQVGVAHSHPAWPWKVTDQTTATITSGSSGGGVFNSSGEVVGIVVGGPHKGDFGFAHYIPVRVIAEDKSIRWAIW